MIHLNSGWSLARFHLVSAGSFSRITETSKMPWESLDCPRAKTAREAPDVDLK